MIIPANLRDTEVKLTKLTVTTQKSLISNNKQKKHEEWSWELKIITFASLVLQCSKRFWLGNWGRSPGSVEISDKILTDFSVARISLWIFFFSSLATSFLSPFGMVVPVTWLLMCYFVLAPFLHLNFCQYPVFII